MLWSINKIKRIMFSYNCIYTFLIVCYIIIDTIIILDAYLFHIHSKPICLLRLRHH